MRNTMTRVRCGATALVMLLPTLVQSVPLVAQSQASDTTLTAASYRSPHLALAEPARGENLPQDKPSIVLRYSRGEPDDPLDLTSLVVLVDGDNRSAQFHADTAEAWGSIDPLVDGSSAGQALALGVHQVTARICSSRSICADLRETVTIAPSVLSAAPTQPRNRKSRLLSALALFLAFLERLFTL